MHALALQKAHVARVVQVQVMLSGQDAHSRFDDCCEPGVTSDSREVSLRVLELPDLRRELEGLKACSCG
jgi:hypothetical protein